MEGALVSLQELGVPGWFDGEPGASGGALTVK